MRFTFTKPRTSQKVEGSSLPVRFWAKVVVQDDDCWYFRPGKRADAYRMFSYRGQTVGAHRVSWELTYGAIPDGLQVLHHCDVPACVNPAHLWVGTAADNRRDCRAKGRFYQHLHRLTALEQQQCRTARVFGISRVGLMRAFGVRHWQVEKAQKDAA